MTSISNESFHEHRQSFRSLVRKFDKSKGSFSVHVQPRTVTKKRVKNNTETPISSGLDCVCEEADEVPVADSPSQKDDIDEHVQDKLSENHTPETHVQAEEPKKKKKKKRRTPKFVDDPFQDHYEVGAELGSGAYAVVKDCMHRKTKKSYAVKIVDVENLNAVELDALQEEIEVMAKLKHDNIVQLYETFREDQYYIVTEKMMGGELLDRVVQKEYYNEKEARDTCQILFEAINYCHSKRIAHRDLKPENLLLLSNDSDSNIKIADFGFAKKCPADGLTTMCGTPSYVAPEIIERVPYGTQCDMWSLGCIVYILLGGYSPFDEPNQNMLFDKIVAGDFTFADQFWSPISEDAKDLIRSLITVDPSRRLTAEEALQHQWMKADDNVLASMDLCANLTELQKFNAKRKFKAAVNTIIATTGLVMKLS